MVCIGLCHPASVIASTVSSSSSSGASSVQSTSNSPLGTSREAGDSRQPRRRSKRRPRPKRRKAGRTGTGFVLSTLVINCDAVHTFLLSYIAQLKVENFYQWNYIGAWCYRLILKFSDQNQPSTSGASGSVPTHSSQVCLELSTVNHGYGKHAYNAKWFSFLLTLLFVVNLMDKMNYAYNEAQSPIPGTLL